jgi:hypothetical protein
MADLAARWPLMPWAPPPGGVEAEQRKTRSSGVEARCGAEHELPEGVGAPGDVAPHQVGVEGLEARRRMDAAIQHHVGKSGGEFRDQAFDRGEMIVGRPVGDVGISPQCMSSVIAA